MLSRIPTGQCSAPAPGLPFRYFAPTGKDVGVTHSEGVANIKSAGGSLEETFNPPPFVDPCMQMRHRTRINHVETNAKEMARLRQEVERLRQDLDHVLKVIGQDLADQPAIYLHDGEGRTRGVLGITENGMARVEIWNEAGQIVASMGETPEGAGEILVAGANGKLQAAMKGNEAGGTISAQNADGQAQALMLAKETGGTFVVTNAHGTPMAEMFGDEKGGTVHIKEPTGRSMAYMSAAAECGVVSVFNEFGDQAAALASDDDGGAVVLFDQDGKIKSNPS